MSTGPTPSSFLPFLAIKHRFEFFFMWFQVILVGLLYPTKICFHILTKNPKGGAALNRVVELVGGGSVINEATLSSFYRAIQKGGLYMRSR